MLLIRHEVSHHVTALIERSVLAHSPPNSTFIRHKVNTLPDKKVNLAGLTAKFDAHSKLLFYSIHELATQYSHSSASIGSCSSTSRSRE